jgi:hypothetical protein
MLDAARGGNTHATHIQRIAADCAGVFMLCGALSAHADYIVPASAVTRLTGGTLNLSCTDLIVAGSFDVGSGSVRNARNVTVQPGGTISGGSGSIALSGNWTVSPTGQYVPGTSSVRFDDNCGAGAAAIAGNTSFYDVHFTSTTGRNFIFAAGSTQTISHLFEFTGTASAPSQFRSSGAGQVAYIDLQPGGTQSISHVGVTDVWAIGQWLAPFQTNEGGGGNARRWFGDPNFVEPIPTIGTAALAALATLLAAAGALARDGRVRRPSSGSRNVGRRRSDR